MCIQMEAFLQQKQAEQDKQLKQQEMEFRREADIELDIQRQKKQELINKYQSEKQQLQNKVQMTDHVSWSWTAAHQSNEAVLLWNIANIWKTFAQISVL